MISVYPSLKDARLGGENFAYVAGQDGVYRVYIYGGKDKPIEFGTVKKSKFASSLDAVDETLFVNNIVPIPATLIGEATSIFRKVCDRTRAEMVAILRWRIRTLSSGEVAGEYFLDRPDYAIVDPGLLNFTYSGPRCGTIHSHGTFPAGFSGIDEKFEREDVPGMYLVIGDLDSATPSIVASILGDGMRVVVDTPDIPAEILQWEISDDEFMWWTENVVTLKHAKQAKGGYYLVDHMDRVKFWTFDVTKAEDLAKDEVRVVKVTKKTRRMLDNSWFSETPKKKKKRGKRGGRSRKRKQESEARPSRPRSEALNLDYFDHFELLKHLVAGYDAPSKHEDLALVLATTLDDPETFLLQFSEMIDDISRLRRETTDCGMSPETLEMLGCNPENSSSLDAEETDINSGRTFFDTPTRYPESER